MLTDFRCYAHAAIETPLAPIVLTGPNGAGKTNVLEAISYLTPGRGLKSAKLPEVSRRAAGEDVGMRPWAVAGRLALADGDVDLGSGWGQDGAERRTVRINGAPARGQSALGEYLSVVWLIPAMDRLFSEGAGHRRRFVDRLVLGLDPEHASRTAAFDQAARQRNRLLAENRNDAGWLAALEDTMARYGVAVTAARLHLVEQLGTALAARADGPFPRARLVMTGPVEDWLATLPAVDVEDRLKDALAANRRAVLAGAETPAQADGPNRSDLAVWFADTDRAAQDCSTGEQKALLLSILLAHARLHREVRGCPPVLLLDEVVAHLDPGRRAALFEEIRALKAQAWMTGTDAALFADIAPYAHMLTVEAASVGTGQTSKVMMQ